jgi:hypothetical protein
MVDSGVTGEISIGGVYMPALLGLALVALFLTGLLIQLLSLLGAYRIVAFRPVVDLALFILVLGVLSILTAGVLMDTP